MSALIVLHTQESNPTFILALSRTTANKYPPYFIACQFQAYILCHVPQQFLYWDQIPVFF